MLNRKSYIDSMRDDLVQIDMDVVFYEKEAAERQILMREYFSQKKFRCALLLYRDYCFWKKRIRTAIREKHKLGSLIKKASDLL